MAVQFDKNGHPGSQWQDHHRSQPSDQLGLVINTPEEEEREVQGRLPDGEAGQTPDVFALRGALSTWRGFGITVLWQVYRTLSLVRKSDEKRKCNLRPLRDAAANRVSVAVVICKNGCSELRWSSGRTGMWGMDMKKEPSYSSLGGQQATDT